MTALMQCPIIAPVQRLARVRKLRLDGLGEAPPTTPQVVAAFGIDGRSLSP
jgi:hypothetical protein